MKDDLVKELYLDFASNTKVSFEKVRLEPAWGLTLCIPYLLWITESH